MGFWDGVGQLFKGWLEKPNVTNHSVSDAQRELEADYNQANKGFEDSYIATQQTYDFARRIVGRAITEASHLQNVEQQVSEEFIIEITDSRLLFLQVDELISHLEIISSNGGNTDTTVDGYSVTVGYTEIDSQ